MEILCILTCLHLRGSGMFDVLVFLARLRFSNMSDIAGTLLNKPHQPLKSRHGVKSLQWWYYSINDRNKNQILVLIPVIWRYCIIDVFLNLFIQFSISGVCCFLISCPVTKSNRLWNCSALVITIVIYLFVVLKMLLFSLSHSSGNHTGRYLVCCWSSKHNRRRSFSLEYWWKNDNSPNSSWNRPS